MAAKIVWVRGSEIGREFELGDAPLTIGRSSECAVVVASGRASRRHAEVRADPGGFLVADLGSANGTIVNGERIEEPFRLRDGDLFEVGDELFRFTADSPGFVTTVMEKLPELPPPPDAGAKPAVPGTPPRLPRLEPPPPFPAPRVPPAPPAPAGAGRRRWLLLAALVVVILVVAAIAVATTQSRGGSLAPPPSGAGLASVAALGAAAPAGPAAGPAAWTVLVYMAGDNDLEADALRDLNEMEQADLGGRVRVVVQLDRAGKAGAGARWSGARRYLVRQDSDTSEVGSELLQDLGPSDTGDPQALADFVVWGARRYPAERLALVIWDHGSAWVGTAFDAGAGGDGLTMPKLAAALQTAQAQLDGRRLDLIGFDACMMGQLDVLLAVAPYGRVAVASPELEPIDGWDWRALLDRLAADPSADGPALARDVVATYGDYYRARDDRTATLAAFDLPALEGVAERAGALADAAAADLDGSYQSIAEARSYVGAYSQPRTEEFSAVDLGDLARLIGERGAPPAVAGRARELGQAIDESRVAIAAGQFHAGASGLSVFFPQSSDRLPDAYDQLSPLARGTSWARFLRAFLAAGEARSVAPRISGVAVGAEGGQVAVSGSVAGRDIASVFFFVGVPNEGRTGVRLVDVDYVRPPGASGAPAWDAGPHQLAERWGVTQWGLDNGATTIPVLLGPARLGSDLYGVEGRYQAPGADPIDAALLFRLADGGGRATLQSVYGFPRGQSRAAQPFEIIPSPGDQFTAQIRTYDVDGGRLVPGLADGDTITFGETPLSAVQLPAAPGAYVAGFLVRDIAGRFSYEYRDIRVTGS